MQPTACPKRVFGAIKFLLLLVSISILLIGSSPALLAQDGSTLYLPAIQGPPPPALYGTVTYEGKPIAGITINLVSFSSSGFAIIARSVTTANGDYQFLNVPPQLEHPIFGEFDNYSEGVQVDDRFASFCDTRNLNGYDGSTVHLADFDIDGSDLLGPSDGSTVKLPVTFSWTHQPVTAGEYFVQLRGQDDERFFSPVVEAMSYKLEQLPEGFVYQKEYSWDVGFITHQVICFSSHIYQVTFQK